MEILNDRFMCVYRKKKREREREQEEAINLQNAIFLRQLSCEMFVARKSTFKGCDFARFPRNVQASRKCDVFGFDRGESGQFYC